ncbi:MAG: hypothetical protein MI866_01780 [Bacteroidales bacterium]|nr:hypothetical protein [Bacteroidales bacterium]
MGPKNTSGKNNQAGYDITTGYGSTFMGQDSGSDVGEGYENTLIGQKAGICTEFGYQYTFVGAFAGWYNNRTNNSNDANFNTSLV